tara:strand:+ start:13527 stop:14456 length:930 start_codon:yes stop_codon:yes gene_type:complete
MTNTTDLYDIIGDIHGEFESLEEMLQTLGYRKEDGVYTHPERKAVFVGDFVDRGFRVIDSLCLIKNMVDYGSAYAIVGNHELNVLAYYTKDDEGIPLREHSMKNKAQIRRTYLEFQANKEAKKIYLKWLRSLPLFLEFDDFRVVHACWDQEAIDLMKVKHPENRLNKKFLRKIYGNKGKLYSACMLLLKGREFALPNDLVIKDSYGIKRSMFRIKWWNKMEGESFSSLAFGNRFKLPNYTIPLELCTDIPSYSEQELPVFFGHYCLNEQAGVVRDNLCCVDACVANGGHLVAYRWDGNRKLSQENIVEV